jgi:tetratricopeptide (TPR) repeat protein
VGETGAETPGKKDAPSWINRLIVYAVPSLLSLLVFGLPYLFVLRRFPAVTPIPFVFYLSSFAALVGTAIALLGDSRLSDRFWREDLGWFYPILALVVSGLVMTTSLNLVRADVCFYLGRLYERADRWDQSVAFYEQAVGLAPAQDHYYRFLGHAYLKNAQLNTPQRPAWLGKAEETLERAVQISPLNPDHRGNLGNLYHAWADVTGEPGQKVEKLRMALAHYQESVSLAPQTHGRLLEDAIFEAHVSLATALGRLGRTEEAVEEARAARDVAPAGREQEAEELIATLEALEP